MHRFTATAAFFALVSPEAGAAHGIELYGEAWLGLGYNIDNEGDPTGEDDLRAVSSVTFGVSMSGETDRGIVFGADIEADEAEEGDGGSDGQIAGNVFVSGDFGTLTYGDTDGADYYWVGDIPGNLSLTGLGDLEETFFISNGGDFGDDEGASFAENLFALPTVRYDYEFENCGFSLSTNRDLTDVGFGAGYSADLAGGVWEFGVGYYDFGEFQIVEEAFVDSEGNIVPVAVLVAPSGTQWSAGLSAEYEAFEVGAVYTAAEADDSDTGFKTLGIGATIGWEALTVGGYYHRILDAGRGLAAADGTESYGVTAAYDLGSGVEIQGGLVRTFNARDVGDEDDPDFVQGFDGDLVADFGIYMAF